MRITFAGVGNAFTTPEYYQSNMLFEENGKYMLFDCGSDARFSLKELGFSSENGNLDKIEAVYISHLHADHIGGLEWLAFTTYFKQAHLAPYQQQRPMLFVSDDLVDELVRTTKAGLGSLMGQHADLRTFFNIFPVATDFVWQQVRFEKDRSLHVMDGKRWVPCYGLRINTKKQLTFISADSIYMLGRRAFVDADEIFHDCETGVRSTVHAHYDELKNLPKELKAKMWLYHYGPGHFQKPWEDGFKGFVYKGQSFEV